MRRSSLPRLPWLDETSHCLPYDLLPNFLTFGSIFAKVPVTQPLQLSGIFTSAPQGPTCNHLRDIETTEKTNYVGSSD